MRQSFTKTPFFFLLFLCTISLSQQLSPGVDRWPIKTSTLSLGNGKAVQLSTLLNLASPCEGHSSNDYLDQRIADTYGGGLKDGSIITTKGYLHLVALERASDTHRDGDYHIQISTDPEDGDNCFIVEIPYPGFINDPDLKEKCEVARQWIKDNLLNDSEPSTGGNVMQHQVHVWVRGQLFADLVHCHGNPRGKRGMKSHTVWEIHPVFGIGFANRVDAN